MNWEIVTMPIDAKEKTTSAETMPVANDHVKFPGSKSPTVDGAQSGTKGLSGEAKVGEGAGYYAEILAYRSVAHTADKIVSRVFDHLNNSKEVVVTDQFEFGSVAVFHRLIKAKLKLALDTLVNLLDAYEDVAKPTEDKEQAEKLIAPASIAATLGAAADILAFFKINVDIKKLPIEIANKTLLVEVVRALKQRNHTREKLVFVSGWGAQTKNTILDDIEKLLEKRTEVVIRKQKIYNKHAAELLAQQGDRATREAHRTELARIDRAPTENRDRIEELRAEIRRLDVKIADRLSVEQRWNQASTDIDNATNGIDALIETLTSRAQGTVSPVESVADYDLIASRAGATVLHTELESHGGEIVISKWIFLSDRVSYIGGCVAVYIVTDRDGAILSSGTAEHHLTAYFKGADRPAGL